MNYEYKTSGTCSRSIRFTVEDGKVSVCGRCGEIPGLCEECGFAYVAEYTLLFRGNIKVIFDMLKTYLKYI